MDARKLARMANDIASFFDADPDRQAAVAGITSHLKRFWDPRMRRELLRALDEGGDHGLRDSVVAALRENRETLMPTTPSDEAR